MKTQCTHGKEKTHHKIVHDFVEPGSDLGHGPDDETHYQITR